MKFGAKEKNTLIGLIGVILAVCAWYLVASPMKEKTDALRNENVGLKETKDEYEAINAQKGIYEQGIVDLKAEREQLLSAFPAAMTKEDEIMYWANMERAYADKVEISDIAMNAWEEVYAGDPAADAGEEEEEGATQLHLYRAPVDYTYAASYDGIKGMVDYINAQKDKKGIETFDISFDSTTGNLVGTMSINMYYMVGTGNEYVPTIIPTVPTGVTNIFKTTNTTVVKEGDGVSGFETETAETTEE